MEAMELDDGWGKERNEVGSRATETPLYPTIRISRHGIQPEGHEFGDVDAFPREALAPRSYSTTSNTSLTVFQPPHLPVAQSIPFAQSMGALSWTTPQQAAYLWSQMPEFLASQGATHAQRERMRIFHAKVKEYFFARWTAAVEADEFREADRKADDEENAAMIAAGRTEPTAAQKAKQGAREARRAERVLFADEAAWVDARTPVCPTFARFHCLGLLTNYGF